jgi:hypothetical protein
MTDNTGSTLQPATSLPKDRLTTGRLTASRLALAQKCPGAFALPHVETENEASKRGIAIHAHIEKVLSTGETYASYIKDPAVRGLCENLDPHRLYWVVKASHDTDKELAGPKFQGPLASDLAVMDEIFTELPFALNPETGEARPLEHEPGNHRDYTGAPEGWVCGTADVVTVAKGMSKLSESVPSEDEVIITDWKTGMVPVENPEDNLQLRFLALAASRAYGVKRAVVQVAYISPDGEIAVSAFEFGSKELDEIEEQIRSIASRIENTRKGSLELKVGSHCRYCPALRFCPAQASAARSLLDNVPEEATANTIAEKAGKLTSEEAAIIWERLQAVKNAVKMSEEVLQAYVLQEEGVDLPEGNQLRLVTSKRDKILPEVSMPLLRDLYGDDADQAVSITKKGITAVAGKKAGNVIKEIEAKGGIQTSYSERLQEVGRKS